MSGFDIRRYSPYMSTQGWRNGRIRGDAYDHFIDKYYLFLFVTDG
jgi:hypothetical protein